jgi:two-component system OmpR family response regulator
MRVLLIEDEPDLAAALARALADDGFAVDVSGDGNDGLHRAVTVPYDAVILDVMLPGRDGWSVLREMRASGAAVPVLMLTARDAVVDRVRGLNQGADDYLTKPFDVAELIARLRALDRRAAAQPAPVVALGDVRCDLAARRVFRGDAEVELTGREFGVLELLVSRRGQVVTRTEIADRLYDDNSDLLSNAIDVHVGSLRRKLGAGLIQTRRGLGYLIDV